MKIVFLDRKSIGEDLDLSNFENFGEVVNYDFTYPKEVPERVTDADIIVVNKTLINEETVGSAENLKLVCVTATGTNNLDKEYLESRGIAWRNVAGYSTDSVAQHTFAMLFYLYEHLPYYDHYVSSGAYIADRLFTHFERNYHELAGKVWGIIGFGAIGRRVAVIAASFGCRVQYYSTSGKNHNGGDIREVGFDELLRTSDIISIHAPLNENTEGLMNKEAFEKMKPTSILLNLGRGPIINEADLVWAIENEQIAAAALDVLSEEPMRRENPMTALAWDERLLITPHIAWASVEARRRLMDIIYMQIKDFLANQ
ncbi:MAG: D-2-hydroxyacid dehydrogenase [Lachnospiraceae bacterium]|nr:D-2-hydroxyacid dehydrogenase [Lachnospiraceae bacterium]